MTSASTQHEQFPGTEGEERAKRRTRQELGGGSSAEMLAGAGAVVLAVLGLGEVLPEYMAAISTILVGVALLVHGATVTAAYPSVAKGLRAESSEKAEIGGATGAEFVGGAAGAVLGVLALLDVSPSVLLPVAAIVFGGSLLLGSRATTFLATYAETRGRSSGTAEEAGRAASGGQVLIGLGSVVLGILSLAGAPEVAMTLSLVAMLIVGVGVLLGGAAVGGRIAAYLRA